MSVSPISTDLRVVRCNPTDPDPALCTDPTPENIGRIQEYVRTRDPELAPLLPDATPTWFVLRRLPAAYLSSVLDGIYPPAAQREHAVRASCHRVEFPGGECLVVLPKKSAPKDAPWTSREAAHGVALAGDDWVQHLVDEYGAELIQELGSVVIDLSRLPRGRRGPFSQWHGTVAGR